MITAAEIHDIETRKDPHNKMTTLFPYDPLLRTPSLILTLINSHLLLIFSGKGLLHPGLDQLLIKSYFLERRFEEVLLTRLQYGMSDGAGRIVSEGYGPTE